MSETLVKNITLEQLGIEVAEWSQRNFPNNKPHHPLLGLVEERGELNCSQTKEEAEDAIADFMIYLADYCGRNNLRLRNITAAESIPKALAKLCHYHLKGEQGIRYDTAAIPALKQQCVDNLVIEQQVASAAAKIDFYAALTRVWYKVRQRDWQKNALGAASGELK